MSIVVKGLAAQVTVNGAEPLNDSLVVNGGAGNDTIDASNLHAGQVNLTLNGGDGDDKIIGSAGNDVVNGGKGSDVALLGAGNDVFVWNPGDGSDMSRARLASTPSSSTAPTSTRRSTSRPMAAASA